jgi:acyl-coenzyme A synthetase/AMP-(fatty) acid ligase
MDPFSIDFDPRWYRKMPAGSLSQERYMKHIEEQVFSVLERQQVDVLFATPSVVHMLATRMSTDERARIQGVHYGGIAISAKQYRQFHDAFPRAVHVSGYGNSLFGVFLECGWDEAGIVYSTDSPRVDVDIVHTDADAITPCAVGETGTVLMSRYDESFLIINMIERDCAAKVHKGIQDPRPYASITQQQVLY